MAQLVESRSQLELRTLELQRLSGQLLRIQDDERRRIARALHDDLGQQLVSLKMAIDKHTSHDAELTELANSALLKVRNLSYLLHPPLLDESGLLPAIHWYIDGFRKRSEVQISFDYEPKIFPRLEKDIEVFIFRIIQESITNVYRHSGSTDARIEIQQECDRVNIRVRDFGKGIDARKLRGGVPISTGAGLGGMKERLKQFGGELTIKRAEPGTLLEASIPLFRLQSDI